MSITLRAIAGIVTLAALAALGAAITPACSDRASFPDGAAPGHDGAPGDLGEQGDAYVNPCEPGLPPAITGRVFAPNGVDPVAGARIYVPVTLAPLPAQVQCESCSLRGRALAQTVAEADGTFKLERVPNATTFNLVVEKGYFRRVIEIDGPDCDTLALPADKTRLPGATAQYGPRDTIPKIAVVTGVYDRLEKVLDKLGVTEKTIFNGRDGQSGPQSLQALLQNGALMRSFHLLFINCGQPLENLITSAGPARNNLQAYVRAGGRLMATDRSYDFIEQTFPSYIDFHGEDGLAPDAAEAHNTAEVGTKDITVQADVLDPQLKTWLASPEIDALLPDGRIELLGFDTGWALPLAGDPQLGVKSWIQGPVKWVGGTGVRPLTISFDFLDGDGEGCGRVIFSSYHTFGNAPVLLAQERVMEFMMLEMGSCIRVQ